MLIKAEHCDFFEASKMHCENCDKEILSVSLLIKPVVKTVKKRQYKEKTVIKIPECKFVDKSGGDDCEITSIRSSKL